eukprot:s1118_g20.t1
MSSSSLESNEPVPNSPSQRPFRTVHLLGLALLGYLIYCQAGFFHTSLEIYRNQLEGLCLDGRNSTDESLDSIHFEVISQELSRMQEYGPATETPELRCAFPVTVAARQKDSTDLPRYQRVRTESTGVYCWGVVGFWMFGESPCKDEIWDCSSGRCSGYEKSQKLCNDKFKLGTYPCLFDPQNPAAGILEERATLLDPIFSGIVLLLFAVILAVFCWKTGLIGHLCGITTCFSKVKPMGGFMLKALFFISILVMIQREFLIYLLPGESYYSLFGAPVLAVPSVVKFQKAAPPETAVPVGFNLIPTWGAAIVWIIWLLQFYLGMFLGAILPLYAAYKVYRSRAPPEDYRAMSESSESSAEEAKEAGLAKEAP